MLYLWIKALHVIAVIAWMAGMLYLPRLFVYHCEAQTGSIQSETFKIMERRLLKAIINAGDDRHLGARPRTSPGTGAGSRRAGCTPSSLLVVILSGVHGFLSKAVKDFAADRNTRPARFYRILNEVPTVLMIVIVILVIVKPF